MNNFLFSQSFLFTTYNYEKSHRYNASGGTQFNFLAYMKSGYGRLTGENIELTVQPGDIFFIPYGCQYISEWHGDKINWDSYAFLNFPNPKDIHYPMQKLTADDHVRQLLEKFKSMKEVNCASVGMLYTIFSLLQPGMINDNESKDDMIYKKAVNYINHNLTASVPEIAKFCSISESLLYSIFKNNGTTPMKIKKQVQLDTAVLMLQTTDLTVDDIAERCGLGSAPYLIRTLKSATGKTTREIRKNGFM